MNVARTVAMNAGYVPGGSKHVAAAPKGTRKGVAGKAAAAAKHEVAAVVLFQKCTRVVKKV